MRTWFEICLISGVPNDSWKQGPFVVAPFAALLPKMDSAEDELEQTAEGVHPFRRAIIWRRVLDQNPAMTTRFIAEHQGITPGRVRQILRLAGLAPKIIEWMAAADNETLSYFGEARLRSLVPLSPTMQIKQFNELLSHWHGTS